MKELILAFLLTLSPYFADKEAPEARVERLNTIATAIDHASLDQRMVALLVTVAVHESTLAKHVHEGRCRPWECDRGLAVSLFQLHSSPLVPKHVHRELAGADLEATTRAALAAANVLSEGLRRCGSSEGALAFYAIPSRCRWSGAEPRMRTYQKVLDALQPVASEPNSAKL